MGFLNEGETIQNAPALEYNKLGRAMGPQRPRSEGFMHELGQFSVRCPEKGVGFINGKVSPGQARKEDVIPLDPLVKTRVTDIL